MAITVIKTNGKKATYEKTKIVNAVMQAMAETNDGVDHDMAMLIADACTAQLETSGVEEITTEDIHNKVEEFLMDSKRKDVARAYMLYRNNQRKNKTQYGLLSKEFLSRYKHQPSPMNQLGAFVYYRTYSRFIPELGRREYWWETVRRAVEYNCSLVPGTTVQEAEELFDNVYNLRQFLSGRTFWVGNTAVAHDYPMANYNCAFEVIDNFEAFGQLFYLLMIGSGVGVRVLKKDVAKLQRVRSNFEVTHADYNPFPKSEREDNTSIEFFYKTTAKITIGDSKEGWQQALERFFDIVSKKEYKDVQTIIIDYNMVRPKGEKLMKFGGTASGHESLKNMFAKIDRVFKQSGAKANTEWFKLRPIDCLDIANIIGENVVSGGVRRTSEIGLIDADDNECIEAKSEIYKQVDGQWVANKALLHRQMSNNSIFYETKPTREKLHWMLQKMRYSGEPGWVNAEAARKRRPNMNGVNPCGEILLDSKGLCNLTTLNVFAFVMPDKSLDVKGLLKAQRLSTRAGYRMTCVELELPQWDNVQNRDRLIGCSLTGWQDMVNATNMSKEDQAQILSMLREVAHDEAKKYAEQHGGDAPLLATTVKPEGTLSQLPTVSSGVHYSHSPYYIRRVRISSTDPLVKVCEELGYPVLPEVGQDIETCVTKVIEFPVMAPDGRTKYDVSAIEQLENYKMFMKHYVDHNCSITVHVRNDEWEAVEQWVWDNWDDTIALSFLSLDDSFYQLMPYESIDEMEYERRVKAMKPFIPSLISKYEKEEVQIEVDASGCEAGVCPVR